MEIRPRALSFLHPVSVATEVPACEWSVYTGMKEGQGGLRCPFHEALLDDSGP